MGLFGSFLLFALQLPPGSRSRYEADSLPEEA